MHFSSKLSFTAIIALSFRLAHATPHQLESLSRRATGCENSAADRSCWGDYNLTTNWYEEVPDTGVTREYWFQLQNGTLSPDGVSRSVLTVNGSIPGPTIEADWGDTVIIHVDNALTANGTSLHFHGIRQNGTNQNDGVISITQCPTAPGGSITYTWRATQYGSSWYHSHYALQAWEGVLGGIVIHGPATGNYDVDLGNMVLMDWSHETPDALWYSAETKGPVTMDNGLINGTNTYDDDGTRYETTFSSGTSYLLRLVNTAIDTHFKLMIDNHTMTVIATDFVPIVPYITDVLSIGMGQRYDVIVNASEAADNYWLRAIPQTSCSTNDNTDNIKGIIRYNSSSTDDPTTTGYSYTDSCDDEDMSDLVPYLALDAGAADLTTDLVVALAKESGVFRWTVGGEAFSSNWTDTTLLQIYNNATTYSTALNAIIVNTTQEWVYLVIDMPSGNVPHPIHLHGHDFYLLAQGTGTYSSDVTLQTTNPPRRDVAMLPGEGYLVFAFKADNPGAWLAHCHIGWHTDEGFDWQFVETQDEIMDIVDTTVLLDQCAGWETYISESGIEQDFAGV